MNLLDASDKVIATLTKMNSIVQEVANIPAQRGVKTKQKKFFEEYYSELHMNLDTLFETIKNYEIPENKSPYLGKNFIEMWAKYKRFIFSESGKFLNDEREEVQLEYLKRFYPSEEDAIEALKYFMNKGHTFIYKIDYKKQTPTEIITEDEFD